jgi:hypothetical protein
MKDMERQKFDEEWKGAFGNAEVTPSENVWTNIELDLMKAEGEKMKRRLVFYKMMAAASVVFAMCVAGIGVYYNSNNLPVTNQLSSHSPKTEQQITPQLQGAAGTSQASSSEMAGVASSSNENNKNQGVSSSSLVTKNASSENSDGNSISNDGKANVSSVYREDADLLQTLDNSSIETGQSQVAIVNTRDFISSERKLPPFYTPAKVELQFPQPDPVLQMMAKLERRELELRADKKKAKRESKKEEKNLNEKLWTSVGFAAGTFASASANVYSASNAQNAPNNFTAGSDNKVSNQSKATGTYSLGLSMGTKVSKHWVIQGGVNYMAQNSTFEINSVVAKSGQEFRILSTPDDVSNALTAEANVDPSADRVVATASYDVNSNSQFISVPLQAGYMALNRKFGVQINAGVSTDLFLRNTIDAGDKSSLPKATQNSESSFYRPVNFSGLFGTEVSYRFGSHYRISLIPGLRYPFNSIYKDEVKVVSTPLTIDLAMKFRYIFN